MTVAHLSPYHCNWALTGTSLGLNFHVPPMTALLVDLCHSQIHYYIPPTFFIRALSAIVVLSLLYLALDLVNMTSLDFLFGRRPTVPSHPPPSPNLPILIRTSTCGIQLGHYFIVTPVELPTPASPPSPILALYKTTPSPTVRPLYTIPATCTAVFGPVNQLFRFSFYVPPP